MVSANRESGVALIFAIIALAIVAMMVAVVAASLQPRIITHTHLERTVRLTALVDAAMAMTLAELAVDRHFSGVADRILGEGVMSSTATQVSLHEVEVVAVGQTRNWRAVVVARVNVENGPRVLRWHRYQSVE
jgi:type II secretory pathway component PulK